MFSTQQAPAIPLSPSSPPETGLKQRAKRRLSDENVQSPAASPLMSVATKSYVSGYGNVQSSMEEGSAYTSESQPTSAPSFTQQSTQPMTTTANSFPTPVSSIADTGSVTDVQDHDRHRDKRQKVDVELPDTNDALDTNLPLAEDQVAAATAAGSVEAGAATSRVGEEDKSLANLQEEMNRTFLLCRSTLHRISPDPREHLIARYGLSSLQRSVARIDPVNGDKINKLRKSYEGQIKSFALAGRNKPQKTEVTPDGKERLLTMTQWTIGQESEPSQQQQQPEKSKIQPSPDFITKLQHAVQLQPGPVRHNATWEEILGHERSRPGDIPTTKANPLIPTTTIPPRLPINGSTMKRDVIRPRRQGKKRSYADDSFEGYGDGFVDDDLDVHAGQYTEDDNEDDDGDGNEMGSARKKRRRE